LVINGAVQAVVGYVDFFDTLQEIFVFFGCSLNRWAELAFTAEHAESLKLKKLTPTRWASRIHCVRAVKNRYTDIMKVLSRISLESTNSKESSGASGLRKRMGTYEFIVSVVVWERVLVATNKASVELQSTEMDLSRAEMLLSMALAELKFLRSSWESVLLTSKALATS